MLEAIKKFALDLGATDARIISTENVVVEKRVVLKCKYWCNQYGMNWACPPYVPSVEEFRSILREYRHVLVARFQSSAKGTNYLTGMEESHKGAEDLGSFYRVWEEDSRRVHEILLKLEKFAFINGFPFALGLRAGSCNLCPKCDVTKPCVHPEKLRFSPESVGVNLIKTLENAKINLKVPVTKLVENPSVVIMLLVN
ncbi:MAG: DUF2284 domain-containing protein [Candidatus Bathyarchaeia archaeon]